MIWWSQEDWKGKSSKTLVKEWLRYLGDGDWGHYGERLPILFAEIERRYPDMAKRKLILADAFKEAAHTPWVYSAPDLKLKPLLELGMDVETRDEQGNTPFLRAAENPWLPSLRLLIKHKANVHAVNHDGENALHLVVRQMEGGGKNDERVLRLLSELGVSPAQQDTNGMTPLIMLAAQQADVKLFQLFESVTPDMVNLANRDGRNALYYAATHASANSLAWLVAKGGDVNLPVGMEGGMKLLQLTAGNHQTTFEEKKKTFGQLFKAGVDIPVQSKVLDLITSVEIVEFVSSHVDACRKDFTEEKAQLGTLAERLDPSHPAFAETQQRALLWCGAGLLPELFSDEKWQGKEHAALALYDALHAAMPEYWQGKMDATIDRSEWRRASASADENAAIAWTNRTARQQRERIR